MHSNTIDPQNIDFTTKATKSKKTIKYKYQKIRNITKKGMGKRTIHNTNKIRAWFHNRVSRIKFVGSIKKSWKYKRILQKNFRPTSENANQLI